MLLQEDRYLGRKIDCFLQVWQKTAGRKPLLIKGARQIGKTEAVRHFARGRYAHFHEINFVLREEFKQIVEDGCSVASILRRISLIEPTWKFEAGKTLIFFDEVQDLPQIAASLKSFAQDGRFDVIASGSMLGIQYKQISSLSMGYKTDVEMLAMDFEEFLRAKGYQDAFFEDLYGKMREARPFDALERKVMGYLNIYGIIPLNLFINEKGLAKLEIALCQGKHDYDKRQSIREREDKRELDRLMRR